MKGYSVTLLEQVKNYRYNIAKYKYKKGEKKMITLSLKGVLIGILLIALIVLVSHATETVKKANAMMQAGETVATETKAKVDGVVSHVRAGKHKVEELALTGYGIAKNIYDRFAK